MADAVDGVALEAERIHDGLRERHVRELVAAAKALDEEEPRQQHVAEIGERKSPPPRREDQHHERQRHHLERADRDVLGPREGPREAERAERHEDWKEPGTLRQDSVVMHGGGGYRTGARGLAMP